MGVVNVTPDSFSDGGDNLDSRDAAETARRLSPTEPPSSTSGASRPGPVRGRHRGRGAAPCRAGPGGGSAAPRLDRHAKAEVAARAIELGADARERRHRVAGRPGAGALVADAGVYVCLMHMQGEPRTMQVAPRYDDVVDDVTAFLEDRLEAAVAAGVREEHVCLDPASASGRRRPEPRARPAARPHLPDRPARAGGALSEEHDGAGHRGRDGRVGSAAASVGAAVAAFDRGAALFRVHDVAIHVDALAAAAAVERGRVAR